VVGVCIKGDSGEFYSRMVDVPGFQETFKVLMGLHSDKEYVLVAGLEVEKILEQRMHVALYPSHIGCFIKGIQCYSDPHFFSIAFFKF